MNWFDTLRQDFAYGFRQLSQSPGFAAVAMLSLALGIGANLAIFQLVDAVRLRTLPVAEPETLAYIDWAPGSARAGWNSTRNARFTSAQWDGLKRLQQGFAQVVAWSATRFNMAAGGEARNAEGLYVSDGFFRHLGVPMLLGRAFAAGDDNAVCLSPGAVVSHAFWQRELGGDPAAVSRTIRLDGRQFPVIGVTGPNFFGMEVGRRYDVAVPLCVDRLVAQDQKGRAAVPHAWWLAMMGRLRPGWTVERATAQLQAISPELMRTTMPPIYKPDLAKKFLENKLLASAGGTGISGLRQQYERPLWLLLAITGIVLLIACANLANLLLARASVREREVAIRLAIGASRARLIRQFLCESLMLAGGGAVLGALLGQVLSRGLVAFLGTANSPVFIGLGWDPRVLGFTSLTALGTCLLFGLLPALRATRVQPAAAMRAGGRGATAGRERFGLRRVLVTAQVALSLVLLVGALLFMGSLRNLLNTDPGFRAEGVLAVTLDLRAPAYTKERLPAVRRELLHRLSGRPGLVSAAPVLMAPVSGSGWNNDIGPDGSAAAASGKEAFFNRSGPGYFHTLGTPILAGRDFSEHDTLAAPLVAIVNEEFARRYFGGANPVGRTFHREAPAGKPEPLHQIVGLVKNHGY